MKKWSFSINILSLFSLIFLSAGLQTTLWYQFFGSIPAPLFWLIPIVYVILYRTPPWSLVLMYAMGLVVLSFSAISVGMLFVNFFILFILVSTLKSRFYWGGVGYFTLMCLVAGLLFHIIYIISSALFEVRSTELSLGSRTLQILMTPAISIIYFKILKFIDHWTLIDEIGTHAHEIDV